MAYRDDWLFLKVFVTTQLYSKGFSRQYLRKQWSKGGRTASDRQEHKGSSNFPPLLVRYFPLVVGISLAGKTLGLLRSKIPIQYRKNLLCTLCLPIGSVFLLRHPSTTLGTPLRLRSVRRYAQDVALRQAQHTAWR